MLLAEGVLYAQPSDTDLASAQNLFDEAMQLMNRQRYSDACPKFEASQQILPGVGTQFNLADCYERTGKYASAWANFRAVATSLSKRGDTEREQVARSRADQLFPKLSYLTVRVVHPAPGLVLKRDGMET